METAMRELVDPLLGMIAFLILCGFDMASLAGRVVLKRATLCVASALFLIAIVRVLMHPAKLPLPAWCVPLGWLISILGGFLLIYSLALEIPFQRTYLTPGAPSELVTRATYALTRHPGVLWMAMLLVGLLLASRSRAMLIAAPAWLLMDILYVWLQDRVFFARQFADYRQYQRQTPMLLPDLVSLRRCWQTLPWRRERS
jgi:protein-S-isoprenylcysteine O-methyltransferase Ste14